MKAYFTTLPFLLIFITISLAQSSSFLMENQPIADKGNGLYENPILPGRYGDPSIIRDGEDYYMIHSGGLQYAFLMWHSQDLVNWKPFSIIPVGDLGKPWAPDLVKVDNKFYIYVTQTQYHKDGTRTFENFVYYAENIEGPWSEPINLNVKGLIDPGHLTAFDGKRYLYFEKGKVAPLSSDGLSLLDEPKKVYDGWNYPNDWIVECPCLEGPKFAIKEGYYYMISALGGTTGPATSHMASVSRSKSPVGPWEESPYNPLIHTFNRNEKWWSQGHATLITDIEGNWWAVYHAYENNHKNMGRSTLLLPIEWTQSGWPKVKDGISPEELIPKPAGKNRGSGIQLSDNFETNELGYQWICSPENYKNIKVGNGQLSLNAHGNNINDAIKLNITPTNKSYEISVKINIEENAEAGLIIGDCGIGIKKGSPAIHPEEKVAWEIYKYAPVLYSKNKVQWCRAGELPPLNTSTVYLKLKNLNNDIVAYMSNDGKNWVKLSRSFRTEFNTILIYSFGQDKAVFQDFKYLGLD